MPRSCSWTIQSIVAAPSCTSPILCDAAGVKQNALGRGRLAGVDVRGNTDVAGLLERDIPVEP